MFNKPKVTCEIITVKNDYYCVNSNNNNYINIPLYFSIKDSELINKDEISQVSLVNDLETEVIPTSIVEINYLNEIKYDDKIFYQYDLKLEIDFIINNLTIYDDLYLKISYYKANDLKVLIGSLCLYNYQANEEIYYTNLRGLTKIYNKEEMLVGILVKLETSNDINIIDIKSMNRDVEVDLLHSQVVTKLVEENNITELLDDEYSIIGRGNNDNNIIINNEDYLYVALKYNDYKEIQVQGFIIKYEDGGIVKEKVISPFLYYKTNKSQREIIQMTYERN